MPSSKGYKRDFQQEAKTSKARGQYDDTLARNRNRKEATKKGLVHTGDGKDLDHKIPLSKGGAKGLSNVRVTTDNANRSYPRNPDGSMKWKK